MFNNKLETLRTNLIKTLNNSDLEIGAAYYVLKDVCNMLEEMYYNALNDERKKASEGEEE